MSDKKNSKDDLLIRNAQVNKHMQELKEETGIDFPLINTNPDILSPFERKRQIKESEKANTLMLQMVEEMRKDPDGFWNTKSE